MNCYHKYSESQTAYHETQQAGLEMSSYHKYVVEVKQYTIRLDR